MRNTKEKNIFQKKLPDGVRVCVTTINARGMVSITGSIAGGKKYFGSQKLASIHAAMLLEGSKSLSKVKVQGTLDDIGASLSFTHSTDRLRFNARVRTVNLKKLMRLLGTVLTEPLFELAALEAFKHREAARLDYEAQDTETQAHILFLRNTVPPEHHLYPETTEESKLIIKETTSEELLKLHTETVTRDKMVVSLAGDVTMEKAIADLLPMYEKLPKGSRTVKQTAKNIQQKKKKISRHSKAVTTINGKESVSLEWGTRLPVNNTHKDFPALIVLTDIIGGPSFSGWLMKTVRERDGLTYGVYAKQEGLAHNQDGVWYVKTSFAPALLEQGKKGVAHECEQAVKAITKETVRLHAEMLAASVKVRVSTSLALSGAMHDLIVDEKKPTYLDSFPREIRKVTVTEVKHVAKKYLKFNTFFEALAGSIENI